MEEEKPLADKDTSKISEVWSEGNVNASSYLKVTMIAWLLPFADGFHLLFGPNLQKVY